MNAHETHRNPRVWLRATIAAAAITGTLTSLGATATHASESGPSRGESIFEQVAERQELRRLVAMMPAGWPATEAMRIQADQPLGDVAQRASWQRAVELMPAEWPATQVMRAELER